MATFTNQATLTYENGRSVQSNIAVGEIVNPIAVTKTAVNTEYSEGSGITYIVAITNTGNTAANNLVLTDNLGETEEGTYPLTYGGVNLYYVNGELQSSITPTTTEPNLVITIPSIPANGNALIAYDVRVNEYAPLSAESAITNEVRITGGTVLASDTETILVSNRARLSIVKSITPAQVTDNSTVTYTFNISNSGNAASTSAVLTDSFDPILTNIEVYVNDVNLVEGTDYTYNTDTGLLITAAGRITVPAATYTRNPDGSFSLTPGTAEVVVTGTI